MLIYVDVSKRYHKVSQSCSEDGICVAVNYWYAKYDESSHMTPVNLAKAFHRYDMEFSGPLYPATSFVRSVSLQNTRGL